jgi:hypothetical protein
VDRLDISVSTPRRCVSRENDRLSETTLTPIRMPVFTSMCLRKLSLEIDLRKRYHRDMFSETEGKYESVTGECRGKINVPICK